MSWDAFLSHASEDKPDLEPLVAALKARGLEIWFDKFEIRLGDSITAKINEGLASSDAGIVVLSEAFFNKKWTKAELNSLLSANIETNKILLPVWHNVSSERVRKAWPLMADRLAARMSEGVEVVAEKLAAILRPKGLSAAPLAEISAATPITRSSLLAYLPESVKPRVDMVYSVLRTMHVGLIAQYEEALNSVEAKSQLESIYQRLLRRATDPLGECTYLPVLFLQGDRGVALVEQAILRSDEFAKLADSSVSESPRESGAYDAADLIRPGRLDPYVGQSPGDPNFIEPYGGGAWERPRSDDD